MPARRHSSAARRPAAPPGRRGRLATAATLLPLAIGLGSAATTPRTRGHVESTADPASSALQLSCTLPFDPIRQAHELDDTCGPEGAATRQPQILQNTAKNGFCASGAEVTLTFADFDALQQAAEAASVTFGSDAQLPKSRSALTSLLTRGGARVGEGSKVRLAAHVIDAHYSNVSRGESVNCQTPGEEFNDIHIVLGERSAADDPCTSITAEMSPHFRPDAWTPDNLNKLAATRLFRFTGQLFFDASHRPCTDGHRSNPPRRSLFEIHPVYGVDVCRTGLQCDVADDAAWVPLHEWLGTGSSESGEGE